MLRHGPYITVYTHTHRALCNNAGFLWSYRKVESASEATRIVIKYQLCVKTNSFVFSTVNQTIKMEIKKIYDTPDPAEYNSNLGLNINNKALPMALHPKVLGLTLDPKLKYDTHIQNIATHAQKPLQVIKALTGTTWGKQKETLVATNKAVMRPTLEYASSIWSPMASPTSINKLQVMQNAALRACTGCTHDTNIQHLHDETNILPIQKHLRLHASQVRQKAQ